MFESLVQPGLYRRCCPIRNRSWIPLQALFSLPADPVLGGGKRNATPSDVDAVLCGASGITKCFAAIAPCTTLELRGGAICLTGAPSIGHAHSKGVLTDPSGSHLTQHKTGRHRCEVKRWFLEFASSKKKLYGWDMVHDDGAFELRHPRTAHLRRQDSQGATDGSDAC